MTDHPTEQYEPYRGEEGEPYRYAADDAYAPPPPPHWTEVPEDGRVVIRDQTAPRMAAAQLLTSQLSEIPEDRRGRMPSGEVRAIVGQAAGTIEALEEVASRVPELLGENELLRAELATARGADDEQALRLWRAGKMAEVQRAAEQLYASARQHAEGLVRDTQAHCAALVADAEAQAQSADPSFPPPPELPEDRIERAVTTARYVDSVRSWLEEKDAEVDASLDALGAELDAARKLRPGRGGPMPDE